MKECVSEDGKREECVGHAPDSAYCNFHADAMAIIADGPSFCETWDTTTYSPDSTDEPEGNGFEYIFESISKIKYCYESN